MNFQEAPITGFTSQGGTYAAHADGGERDKPLNGMLRQLSEGTLARVPATEAVTMHVPLRAPAVRIAYRLSRNGRFSQTCTRLAPVQVGLLRLYHRWSGFATERMR